LKNWKLSVPGRRVPLNWPRPSKGSWFAGLMALLGNSCGAGFKPGSASVRSGSTGGIGIGSRNGVIFGLHPGLHAPRPQLLSSNAQALRPFLLISDPALVSRPALKRSRRLSPALMISNLFLRAFSISLWLVIGYTLLQSSRHILKTCRAQDIRTAAQAHRRGNLVMRFCEIWAHRDVCEHARFRPIPLKDRGRNHYAFFNSKREVCLHLLPPWKRSLLLSFSGEVWLRTARTDPLVVSCPVEMIESHWVTDCLAGSRD